MMYISTRNKNNRVSASEALLQGLAADGGLFVPEEIPAAGIGEQELLSLDYVTLTAKILDKLLPDLGYETVLACVRSGYEGKFDTPEPPALVHAGEADYLELYHGPTSAFKDMALCLLPHLIGAAKAKKGITKETVILTATSGDTGKAALAGFADVPGTRVVVFFPDGGVSAVQRAQMVTQEGDNTAVCAVRGNFDDAQRGVKQAFLQIRSDAFDLSSANSINIGRLAPQVAYYFWAYAEMVRQGRLTYGEALNYTVPTGNFGDILAGWFAKQMGLPVGRLTCASNRNRVLTDFLTTGVYNAARPFFLTASPSMDILVSSNLERLLFYAAGCDDGLIRGLMAQLSAEKCFTATEAMMDFIRRDFDCACADDEESLAYAGKIWAKDRYLMDPHTAVAAACAPAGRNVILSTASPYKFAPAILAAIGEPVPEDGFEAMEQLEKATGVPAPAPLKGLKYKPVRHRDVCGIDEIVAYAQHAASAEH